MEAKDKKILCQAIESHHQIECIYHGKKRLLEPYLYGILGGKEHLHCYQFGGESESGGLPQWRNLRLDDIKHLRIIPHSHFDIRSSYHPENAHYHSIEKGINV